MDQSIIPTNITNVEIQSKLLCFLVKNQPEDDKKKIM